MSELDRTPSVSAMMVSRITMRLVAEGDQTVIERKKKFREREGGVSCVMCE